MILHGKLKNMPIALIRVSRTNYFKSQPNNESMMRESWHQSFLLPGTCRN